MAELPDSETKRVLTDQAACITCAYQLQGLAIDANCPECGTAVTTSLGHAGRLTKQGIVIILCRMLAIWVALNSVAMLPTMLFVINGNQWPAGSLYGAIGLILPLLTGVCLWFAAGKIAHYTLPNNGAISLDPSITSDHLFGIVLFVLGVSVLVKGIANFAKAVIGLSLEIAYTGVDDLAHAAIYVVCGMILCMRVWKITDFIKGLRTAGTQKSSDDS